MAKAPAPVPTQYKGQGPTVQYSPVINVSSNVSAETVQMITDSAKKQEIEFSKMMDRYMNGKKRTGFL